MSRERARRAGRSRALSAQALSLGLMLMTPSALAADFARAKAPSWVTPRRVDLDLKPELQAASSFGLVELLADDQLNLTRPLPEHYRHHARRLLSKEGVAEGSELTFEVDPSYEKLTLHAVRLWRDGKALDALKTATVRSFFREQGSDDRIYDGRKTIVIALHDVRADDIIDYEATISGKNPVFQSYFDEFLPLTQGLAVASRFVRVIPGAAPLHVAAWQLAPEMLQRQPNGDIGFELHGLVPPPDEDDTPNWYDPTPGVYVSNYTSWSDVSQWAAALSPPEKPSPELNERVASFKQLSSDPNVQALAAVRFVQDDVRYLGFELGAYSHQPRPAAEVLTSRFGDCKDKSGLLVFFLRGLGFEAYSALVNADLGAHVAEQPPAAGAFNHAVVALRRAARWQFIDPTRAASGGTLDTMTPAAFGKALILAAGLGDALTDMPDEGLLDPYLDVKKTIQVAAQGDAELSVSSVYRGAAADAMRGDIARSQVSELGRQLLNSYAAAEPSIELLAGPSIVDDREANVIDVRIGFRVPDFVRDGAVFIGAPELRPALQDPAIRLRSTPLSMPHPENVRVSVALSGHGHEGAAPKPVDITTPSFTFKRRVRDQREGGGPLEVAFQVQTHRDHVPPDQVPKHLRATDEAWHESTLLLAWTPREPASLSRRQAYWIGYVVGFLFTAGLFIAVAYEVHVRSRHRRKAR